jgi:hypothetical protein
MTSQGRKYAGDVYRPQKPKVVFCCVPYELRVSCLSGQSVFTFSGFEQLASARGKVTCNGVDQAEQREAGINVDALREPPQREAHHQL